MKFGRIEDIDKVQLHFPKEQRFSQETLQGLEQGRDNLRVSIGLPIWAERNFVGQLYPASTKASTYLYHYTKQFNAIEFNASFYTIPSIDSIQKWKEVLPKDFRFYPKLPQVKYNDMLASDEYFESINTLVDRFSLLEDNLGTFFLQLPISFKYEDARLLQKFIDNTSQLSIEWAIELRHPSWFEEPSKTERAFMYFQKNNIHPVITDTLGRQDAFHSFLTSDKVFIRFLANDLHHTDYERVDWWIQKIGEWIENGMKEIVFFFHNETEYKTLPLIQKMIKELNYKYQLDLTIPRSYEVIQGTLF